MINKTAIISFLFLSINTAKAETEIIPNQYSSVGTYSSETLAKKSLEFAKISKSVYGPEKNVSGYELVSSGYDLVADTLGDVAAMLTDYSSGFEAGLYKKGDQYVLAFTGTDSLHDVGADIAQLSLPTMPTQYILANKITKNINEKHPGKLTLTGHSLGGGLAQYASYKASSSIPTITFNSAKLTGFFKDRRLGDHIININLSGDIVSESWSPGIHLGTTYEYKDDTLSSLESHYIDNVIKVLENKSKITIKGNPTLWANVNIAKNSMVAIVQGGSSHIGSASFGYSYPSLNKNNQTSNTYSANYKQKSGYSSIPESTFLAPNNFAESEWIMTQGNPQTHLSQSKSYGSISAPTSNLISSINNAGFEVTSIEKNFIVPNNAKYASIKSIINFVTTEYPDYIQTQFNDTGRVTITTPGGSSGSIQLLSESVNSSKFMQATNIPAPLSGINNNNGAGHTGWVDSIRSIKVAPGGNLKIRIDVNNVGDTAYPSAVLVNEMSVK